MRAASGQYPVIFLSLKDVEGLSFSEAKRKCIQLIKREAERFYDLKNSERLLDIDKKNYCRLLDMTVQEEDSDIVSSSIKMLSALLYKHYGKKQSFSSMSTMSRWIKHFNMDITKKWFTLFADC